MITIQTYSSILHNSNVPTHQYTGQFLEAIKQYITIAIDVLEDGNCGYRVIAEAMGFRQDSWPRVRKDLLAEVRGCPFLYEQAFGWKERRAEIDQALDYFEDSYAPETLLDEHARYGPSYSFMLLCSGDFFYPVCNASHSYLYMY